MIENSANTKSASLWLETYAGHFAPLNKNICCDVCIIGGGISGLTAAYQLAKSNIRIVLLEKEHLGGGITGYTTAHLSNALHERYYAITSKYGKNVAQKAAQIHTDAIHHIHHIIQAEHIQCDFEFLPGYLIFDKESLNAMEQEFVAASQAGVAVSRDKINFAQTVDCLKFHHQAQFHPLKYLYGLAHTITEKYVGKIFEQTNVTTIHNRSFYTYIHTNLGYSVKAKYLINATNTSFNNHFNRDNDRIATRTYVVVAQIPKNAIATALYWDNKEPYHYVRLHKTDWHKKYDFLLIGGEDRSIENHQNDSVSYINLKLWAKRYFPQINNFCYAWSGQVYDRYKYLDLFQRIPMSQFYEYQIIGGNSNGLTHGTAAGVLVANDVNHVAVQQ